MEKIFENIKIIFISALSLIFLLPGCDSAFLDETPASVLTEDSYYSTVDELETGLTACYSSFISDTWNGFEACHWQLGDVGSDDAEKGGENETDWSAIQEISYSRQVSSNSIVTNLWKYLYQSIAYCNLIIDKSVDVDGDEDDIETIVEQAKFLRGLSYFHLVINFGDVPLVTSYLTPSEVTLARTSLDLVWSQIESDFTDATNLPLKSEWNETGRVTSGAAWAMLGKAYLFQEKYAEANQAFSQVVESGEYSLVSDYGYIFRHDGENCDESIFELQHANGLSGGNMGTYSGVFRISRDADAGGWGFDCPTEDLLNEFEDGDPRTIYTFMYPGDVFPTTSGTYTVANSVSPTGYHSRKSWMPSSERAGLSIGAYDINYRYLRYAEVLLLYAESLNEAGDPSSALTMLNLVRARARGTSTDDPQRVSSAYDLSYSGDLLPDVTTTNQSELREAIWHEQRVELAVEGHRRETLIRTGRFIDRMTDVKGASVDEDELLLPIPSNEIDLSNGLIEQNPGY